MVEKMMILMSNFHLADQIRTMIDWPGLGIEIVSVEYNGALGLEQFAYFKPRIVLIDSMVPIIGIDKFVEEMIEVNSDFLVILLDDSGALVSNIQHIYRIVNKSKIDKDELYNTVQGAIKVLNKSVMADEKYDTSERFQVIQQTLGNGEFSISKLQELRDRVGLNLSSEVSILLPRPVKPIEERYPELLLMIIKKLLDENCGGEILVMNDGVLCILINEIHNSSARERTYGNLLFDIRRILTKEYPMYWTFVLSETISLRKLEKEYASFRKLYDYGYFLGELKLLKKDYIITRSISKQKVVQAEYINTIISAVISGEISKLQEAFEKLFEDYLKKTMDINELYQWRYRLELLFYSFAYLYELFESKKLSMKCFDHIYYTIEEEEHEILNHFTSLQQLIQKTEKEVNPLTYQIISTVIDGYNGDISLQIMADKINIATTYLSHLFKKEMNITFIDYLTLMRVVTAKRMLHEKNQRIQDIANEVGFSDYRYFSRVFRKYTGKTPSEYKEIFTINTDGGID